QVPTTLQNTGTIAVQSGTLLLSGVGNSSGAFTAGTGATLEFGGPLQVLQQASDVSGTGDVRFTGGTTYVFCSYHFDGTSTLVAGTVNFLSDATLARLVLTGGKLAGSGTVTVTDSLDWTEGTMAGPGRTVANGTVALHSNSAFFGPVLDGRTF